MYICYVLYVCTVCMYDVSMDVCMVDVCMNTAYCVCMCVCMYV